VPTCRPESTRRLTQPKPGRSVGRHLPIVRHRLWTCGREGLVRIPVSKAVCLVAAQKYSGIRVRPASVYYVPWRGLDISAGREANVPFLRPQPQSLGSLSPALQRLRGTNTPDSHTTSMRCHSATMALTDNTVAVIELLETKEDFTYVLVEYTEGLTTRGQPPYERGTRWTREYSKECHARSKL